jgi:hypothetical protein
VKWREACRGRACVRCGVNDGTTVPAHYTGVRRQAYGGGFGVKVSDVCVAPLCMRCHAEMDGARDKAGRWEHSEEFQHLILLHLVNLDAEGLL